MELLFSSSVFEEVVFNNLPSCPQLYLQFLLSMCFLFNFRLLYFPLYFGHDSTVVAFSLQSIFFQTGNYPFMLIFAQNYFVLSGQPILAISSGYAGLLFEVCQFFLYLLFFVFEFQSFLFFFTDFDMIHEFFDGFFGGIDVQSTHVDECVDALDNFAVEILGGESIYF